MRLPVVPLGHLCSLDAAEAATFGCDHGLRSTLLKPTISAPVLAAAEALIPSELMPKANDTRASLVARTAKCKWLDDINVYYPSADNLNSSLTSMQPLRKSCSVVVVDKHIYEGSDGEGQGEEVYTLFNYTSFGRYTSDWRGHPMPWEWFVLGLHVWSMCWPYLSLASRRHPPTHVQLLFYHWLRSARMQHHRDNSNNLTLTALAAGEAPDGLGHPSCGAACDNSQVVGSSVMVLTTGTAPQVFTLRFRPAGTAVDLPRDEYEIHPRFQMQMEHGTISVLDPVDDLLVTHGAYFEGEFDILRVDGDPAWLRIGWAFRWLQSAHDFYACPSNRAGMRHTVAMLCVMRNLRKRRRKQARATLG